MKKVIIVESPGKIKSIQKYVGGEYEVLASNGQIVELAKGGRFGIGVNPLNNFKTYYWLVPEKIAFLDKIISNFENIEQIIICTDPDTEGNAIAWHIYEHLKHLNKPIVRAEFHEITKDGITKGLNNIKQLDINQFHAQETRRVLDRIVGFIVSPYLIDKYKHTLSAGRVQSVATKMVVERENDISNFKPKEFWNLKVRLKHNNSSFEAKYQEKLKNKTEADKVVSELQKSNNTDTFKAISVVKKSKKEEPSPPLTTSRLQQIMSSQFGLDGEETMEAAQTLYELGFVTYIRTDSVRISDSALENVREWLVSNNYNIPNKPNVFKNKDTAQNAHECIRPTNVSNLPEKIDLGKNIADVYETIWKYFVSSQMLPAVYDILEVKIQHIPSKYLFKFSGKTISDLGYLSILDNKVSNIPLLSIEKDNQFSLFDNNSIIVEQKFSQPPSRYTYASLIKELESQGIGRPSTFTTIINTIEKRGYVLKKNNSYSATDLGVKINDILDKYFDFMEYNYTANLEKEMDSIAVGNLNYLDVLNNFYSAFTGNMRKLITDNCGKICTCCGLPIYQRSFDSKFYERCALYPFCKTKNNDLNKVA